ncbi:NADPH:quinone oxidoreductase family protein [Streptomyces sp. N50]|uniref:NADPH:quinone oxidoreductase family protein n=1 Tax=Streptomyces sp. N50 TaxID=3081765 RepID=UPI002961F9E5|nr:NADPH:quinone oxidoreductase family protein [Streptomyces sp. N50]WOX16668.1 NADPH:quinone oxidoreductase family protein [Streptomyces sp. N50]
MRAARCNAVGGPVVVEDIPEPPFSGPEFTQNEGGIPVDVHYAAVNFADLLVIDGAYQVKAEPPFTPGSEFAGVVAASANGFEKGERVFGSMFVGAFAERVTARPAGLSRIPEGISTERAAAFGVSHATAFDALRLIADVQPGERVAVLGAAGGVGLATVELAALLGAEVVAVASTEEKRAVCAEQGAQVTLPYDDLKRTLRDAGGADVVIDPVGGPYAEEALRAMRWGGRFVSVGFASGEIPRIPLNLPMLKGVSLHGFDLGGWARHRRDDLVAARTELHGLFAAGRIRPRVHAVYPLADVAEALSLGRRAIGKVLLEVAHGV